MFPKFDAADCFGAAEYVLCYVAVDAFDFHRSCSLVNIALLLETDLAKLCFVKKCVFHGCVLWIRAMDGFPTVPSPAFQARVPVNPPGSP
ncbi:hypothetical protein SFRURICE_015718 [Spodoptera frugiperda]|nr:hypothetical protein SFRURICE_015718 [Spodoptera frugiperda]